MSIWLSVEADCLVGHLSEQLAARRGHGGHTPNTDHEMVVRRAHVILNVTQVHFQVSEGA